MMKRAFNWFICKASIRKKLLISFAILVSIPLAVLGVYAFSESKKHMEEQVLKTMDNNISSILTELNARFTRETDYAKYLAYNLNFRRVLESHPHNNVEIAQTLNNTVEPIFWYFLTSDSYMKEINIYTPYVERAVGSFLKPDSLCVDTNWYQEHQTNFNTVWTLEEDTFYATRTILDTATTSKPIGVLRAGFFPATILDALETMDYLNNGILIQDQNGAVVYHKKTGINSLDENVLLGIADQEGILRSGILTQCGWKVTYYIDRDEISGQLTPIIRSTLLMVGLCLVVILLFMLIFAGTLSTRILRMKRQAEEIAKGNLDTPVFTDDTDEIGVVTNSLGEMTNRLNETIHQVYLMEIEKKKTELRALQAMINPHFLYNSLSSIKWKAIRQGSDDISEITGLLAKFYRTSLNNGCQITTVASELENIKSYVTLQQMTHEDSFTVTYRLDEAGMEASMLNFLLQPIVENAIKHGIDYRENTEEKGEIILEYQQQSPYLMFHIMNNGPRMTGQELNEALNRPGKGYGIFNIQERIALYYGGDCKVEPSVTPDGYTCFTVKIREHVEDPVFHALG